MLHDGAAVRDAFAAAARSFLTTLRTIRDDQWDRNALGEWTVRELAAHTMRAFVTIEAGLEAAADGATNDRLLADAADYYRAALAIPNVHVGVAARARESGARLTDPVGEAEACVHRVVALVEARGDDDVVASIAGQITLGEFVATRVVELAVHTLDLQFATGQLMHLDADVAAIAVPLLAGMADPVDLVRALTGREPLDPTVNVVS